MPRPLLPLLLALSTPIALQAAPVGSRAHQRKDPAHRKTSGKPPAPQKPERQFRELSSARRVQIAQQALRKLAKQSGWIHKGQQLELKTRSVEVAGTHGRSISNSAIVTIRMVEKGPSHGGIWGRLFHIFDPNRVRDVTMVVGPQGGAELYRGVSMAPQFRLSRFVTSWAPRLIHSTMHNPKLFASAGSFSIGSAISVGLGTAVVPGVGFASLGYSAHRAYSIFKEGLELQSKAEDKVLMETVKWTKSHHPGPGGDRISLLDAYSHFQAAAEEDLVGPPRTDLFRFAQKLSLQGL